MTTENQLQTELAEAKKHISFLQDSAEKTLHLVEVIQNQASEDCQYGEISYPVSILFDKAKEHLCEMGESSSKTINS
jgi:hypothetical protein